MAARNGAPDPGVEGINEPCDRRIEISILQVVLRANSLLVFARSGGYAVGSGRIRVLHGYDENSFFFMNCTDIMQAMTLGPQPYYWPNTKHVSYGSSPPIATRTGFMALGLFPFVVLLSSKANWVTLVTGISHEKLQVSYLQIR
jgi:hypothetical protein